MSQYQASGFSPRYGLVGRNGIGKTVLLQRMAERKVVGLPEHLKIHFLRQYVVESALCPLEWVLRSQPEHADVTLASAQSLTGILVPQFILRVCP